MDVKETNHIGTLSDSRIRELCKNGVLIKDNYSPENIKQCCYELRASNIYYDLSDPANSIKHTLSDNDYILIKPRQSVVIISKESLNIKSDLLARILSKGKLFSIGLLPVNTYADPGFYGNLGIVFHNSSNRYIKIKPNEAIAKVEFYQLDKEVEYPYHGQHGYQTNMWPIPEDMFLTEEEIKQDRRIGNEYSEVKNTHGKNIGKLYKNLSYTLKSVTFLTCIYFILMFALIITIADGDKIDTTISISIGIVSNIIFMGLTHLVTSYRKK
ncbi:dCTP deaminase domain-containing protein [Neptuniibacter marinus]|uniref:dCTP deaminase domain-containing protein n=1 Tax=Neptuniibacter marinus TaxID=1806670 RepID=UPI0008299F6B|nr:hypothetical protein [Neptuniibacter marinus]